jgi:hypothetical protein
VLRNVAKSTKYAGQTASVEMRNPFPDPKRLAEWDMNRAAMAATGNADIVHDIVANDRISRGHMTNISQPKTDDSLSAY